MCNRLQLEAHASKVVTNLVTIGLCLVSMLACRRQCRLSLDRRFLV